MPCTSELAQFPIPAIAILIRDIQLLLPSTASLISPKGRATFTLYGSAGSGVVRSFDGQPRGPSALAPRRQRGGDARYPTGHWFDGAQQCQHFGIPLSTLDWTQHVRYPLE